MTNVYNAKVAIVGAGSAGISIAARLLRKNRQLHGQVLLIDPSDKHYYQPLWTLVGGGAAKAEDSVREQASLIPEGAKWLKEAVDTFSPENNTLETKEGSTVRYDYLVVAAGIEIYWDQIKGLKETIGKNGVCSNYSYDYVQSTWENIRNFRGGTAIFTQPSTPVKCGGAPQKIMYLADDYFRQSGVREQTNIIFASGSPNIFAVKRYADTLEQVIQRKNIETKYRVELVEIDGDTKKATFEHLDTNERFTLSFDMIHVTPPMGPPAFIAKSALADAAGWVDVDPYTLQHKTYKNVFGAGDCTNLPTSKTGAAIRKQAPVVAENLLALMNGKPLQARYDGYTSCPLVTGYNKLVLAEFDYDKNPRETFPFDQSKERMSMYVMKKNLLPIMYWNGMLKGLM
ncbi:FAD/NAD(P)-binding oxidoreductase [Geobacillus proteiniphilus]|uniref:FAD/NAD(P)-binding oxidoreductase n=1 Tax=Geobacillus proteiniphilus TaxID=860353 RepID=A0ABY9ML32_9BACL|nr:MULTISPECIES: FAD/NAD(P)-binding oxidoreductase [Geobacillus]MED4972143.1 FAD/NAD(P)-binding oxidoreductase [Geobacillus thermoleovorans]QCK84183.1 NAD(P)/FAD-dependent oxidoreductase [Geobacillus kaustophilus NBRC 102445]WMJ18293.1 FAD/NAD(P)-binding oxidoreductase [Geobacillus proteiniphilus]